MGLSVSSINGLRALQGYIGCVAFKKLRFLK